MPDPEHTPGPWKHNPNSANRIMTQDDSIVAATYGGFSDAEEQAANTRLLTAAPDMYDYVVKKAAEGDAEAQALAASIDAPAEEPE